MPYHSLHFLILLIYIAQRISELYISNKNEKILKNKQTIIEKNKLNSILMKTLHISWFILLLFMTLTSEKVKLNKPLILIPLLLFFQAIRFASIKALKENWVLKILKLEHFTPQTNGIYKYIRHPNYLVVIFEIILIPILLNIVSIGIIYFFLNFVLLIFRINYEEDELNHFKSYSEYKNKTYRLIPYIY